MIKPLNALHLNEMLPIEKACFTSPWSEEQLATALTQPRYRVFGLYQQALLGFAIFSVVVDEVELLQIAVAPEAQRQGVAQHLLAHGIEFFQQQQSACVLLEVRDSNLPARALYRQLGFQVDGVRKAYYSAATAKEQREDAILMSYKFPV